jgi:hypothetical protein
LDARKLRCVLRDGDRDEIEVRDWKGGEPGHNYSGGESRIADALAKGKKKRGKEDPNEGRRRRRRLEVGIKVTAKWKGETKWFPGTVKAANADGTYRIQYEDGDVEDAVARNLIAYVETFEQSQYTKVGNYDVKEESGDWKAVELHRLKKDGTVVLYFGGTEYEGIGSGYTFLQEVEIHGGGEMAVRPAQLDHTLATPPARGTRTMHAVVGANKSNAATSVLADALQTACETLKHHATSSDGGGRRVVLSSNDMQLHGEVRVLRYELEQARKEVQQLQEGHQQAQLKSRVQGLAKELEEERSKVLEYGKEIDQLETVAARLEEEMRALEEKHQQTLRTLEEQSREKEPRDQTQVQAGTSAVPQDQPDEATDVQPLRLTQLPAKKKKMKKKQQSGAETGTEEAPGASAAKKKMRKKKRKQGASADKEQKKKKTKKQSGAETEVGGASGASPGKKQRKKGASADKKQSGADKKKKKRKQGASADKEEKKKKTKKLGGAETGTEAAPSASSG